MELGALIPSRDIERVADAHRRLSRAIAPLTDETLSRPSLLPDWTVGHVLAHLARNADSHVRRAEAAARGEEVDQYPGGYAARNAEIEAGAGRTAQELIADVKTSAERVEEAWAAVAVEAWSQRSRDANGKPRPLFELPSRRWQEIEVHLVDLGIGVTHADWPPEFILEWLPRTRERMWSQLGPETDLADFADPAEELAWLYGRVQRTDLPAPPRWG